MQSYRTDLALESVSHFQEMHRGFTQKQRGEYFRTTEIEITERATAEKFGKPEGVYITLECDSLSGFLVQYPEMSEELAGELRKLIPEQGTALVAGLGNQQITPDALGVKVTEKIIATRHLQEGEFWKQFRPVCALSGGVLGQTGIESAELIQAVCEKIKPSVVIAVDALACTALERLGTTVQIANTGIAPGSGVSNHRKALNRETLGVPVIGIGVPTVINMQYLSENAPAMTVAPREIDQLVRQSAHLLACGINLALHPGMHYADVICF